MGARVDGVYCPIVVWYFLKEDEEGTMNKAGFNTEQEYEEWIFLYQDNIDVFKVEGV